MLKKLIVKSLFAGTLSIISLIFITSESRNEIITVQHSKQESVDSVNAFIKAFESQNIEDLYKQAAEVEELGKPAVQPLMTIVLNHTHNRILRKMAFELIRNIKYASPDSIELMIQIMNDENEDPLIRGEAAWTLGEVGAVEAINPLVAILRDKNEESRIRKLSATSLGLINEAQTQDVLLEIALDTNDNAKVRSAAIEALGINNNYNKEEILINLLEDESWEVQLASIRRASKIKDKKVMQMLHNKLIKHSAKETKQQSEINDAIVKSLIDSLKNAKDSDSVPILINVLKSNDPYYSALAGDALGEIGARESLFEVEEVLNGAKDPFQIRLLQKAQRRLSD